MLSQQAFHRTDKTELVLVLPMQTEAQQLSLIQPCLGTVERLAQALTSIVSSSQRSDMEEGPKRKDQGKNTLPSPTPILESEDEALQKSSRPKVIPGPALFSTDNVEHLTVNHQICSSVHTTWGHK